MARRRISKALASSIFAAANGICALCGLPVEEDQRSIDHIVAVSQGGSDDPSNLQLAHRRCNQRKGPKGGRPRVYCNGERAARIDVRLPLELRRRARVAAAREDIALGEWVARAIAEKLARDEPS